MSQYWRSWENGWRVRWCLGCSCHMLEARNLVSHFSFWRVTNFDAWYFSLADEARAMLQGVGSRFDFHMNRTLCELRMREIFDIIVDYPESNGALKDIKAGAVFSMSGYSVDWSYRTVWGALMSAWSWYSLYEPRECIKLPISLRKGWRFLLFQQQEASLTSWSWYERHIGPICVDDPMLEDHRSSWSFAI